MIAAALTDPFSASGYLFTPSANGQYYVIRSVGPNGTDETATPTATGYVSVTGDDLAASNGTITIAGSVAEAASCVQNIDCASGACGGTSPVCRPTGNTALGAACGGNSDCASSYCGLDGDWNPVCSDGATGIDLCLDMDSCQSGYCDTYNNTNTCSSGALGAGCGANQGCDSGFCNGSICTLGLTGVLCDFGNNCKNGICVNGRCSDQPGGAGDSCGEDASCENQLHCDPDIYTCVAD